VQPGTVIGERFEVRELAGAGGMSAVFRAHDRRSGERVAIKVLLPEAEAHRERFEREAELLAGLDHPAIVRCLGRGVTPAGDPFLALEWLEGETLAARFERGPLGVDQTLVLARRVAGALGAAHARGIVHRDISPGNLVLAGGRVETVKLLDFGVARLDGPAPRRTRTGAVIGTPGYMAPEQARGDRDVGPPADVFALGCVLYECLTGEPAFWGDSLLAVMAKVVLHEPPPAADRCPELPAELDELLVRMLAKAPAERPPDGSVVARELADLGVDRPAERPPSAPKPRAITGQEQRLLSVVLTAPTEREGPAGTVVLEPAVYDERARSVATAHGARLERLAGSSFVAVIAGRGAATDQAARAARCALGLRALLPHATMVLATGRAIIAGELPIGEVIDRAARLLAAEPGAEGSSPGRAPRSQARGRDRDAGRPVSTPLDRRAVRHEAGDEGPAPIRLDEVTAGLLDARFEVGGEARALLLWGEVEALEAPRTLLGVATPCVGRERELGTLCAVFDECACEPVARAVIVVGEAGVGKSRLRQELVQRLAQRDDRPQLWLARGDAVGPGGSFAMLAQIVRRALGMPAALPPEDKRERLLRALAARLEPTELARVAEFLGELLGAAFPDEASVQLRTARADAVLLGDQIRRAWLDFVTAECATQPVLILLEDVQWGDAPTLRCIDAALAELADRPLMVLAVGRPELEELFPELWAARDTLVLRLGGLTPRASEKLLRSVLPSEPADTIARLVALADGNALFLEELVRATAERRAKLPDTLVAMVQSRLEALEPEARRVLRAAAVLGGVFWARGVAALLGGPRHEETTRRWLAHLSERELVVRRPESELPGDDEYGFRHELVREAAYGMLTDADRSVAHRLAGEWLERLGTAEPMVLAEHFERGETPQRAVIHYLAAAEQAINGNDFDQAIARAGRASRCGASGEALGRARLLEAEASNWRGAFAEAERAGSEALRLLAPGSGPWCRAASEVADAAGRQGRVGRLLGLVADVLGLEEFEATPYLVACARLALQLQFVGSAAPPEALVARVEQLAAARSDPHALAWLCRMQGVGADVAGDAATALRLHLAAADHYERAGDLRMACFEFNNAGDQYRRLGAYADAERALRATLGVAERLGLTVLVIAARLNLALVCARTGRLAEARALDEASVEAAASLPFPRYRVFALAIHAEVMAAHGELAQAEQATRAAAGLDEAGPRARAVALGTLARVLGAQGRPREALEAARRGLELARACDGLEEGDGLLRLCEAEALAALGQREEAARAIGDARARLHQRAARIAEPGLRRAFLREIEEHARTLDLAKDWLGDV
jgi:tetratricopeptide (TPR) repeat protein